MSFFFFHKWLPPRVILLGKLIGYCKMTINNWVCLVVSFNYRASWLGNSGFFHVSFCKNNFKVRSGLKQQAKEDNHVRKRLLSQPSLAIFTLQCFRYKSDVIRLYSICNPFKSSLKYLLPFILSAAQKMSISFPVFIGRYFFWVTGQW